jgi:hypothetical protein
MRKQFYVVKLSGQERSRLEDLIRKGKTSARLQLRARILLHADTSKQGSSWNDVQIAKSLATYPTMCARVRRQLAEEGLEAVLSRKKRITPPTSPIFDGETEAKLIALACSPPPAGRSSWTLRLLESKVVELRIVDHASDNTIGRVLKKTSLSPISKSNGLFPQSKTARS